MRSKKRPKAGKGSLRRWIAFLRGLIRRPSMDWLGTLWSRCVAFFGERKLDDELDQELLAHIEFAVEENLRRDMSPQDARRVALLKIGGGGQDKENARHQRGRPVFCALVAETRFRMA